jgi:opacity protein-like surface antigen
MMVGMRKIRWAEIIYVLLILLFPQWLHAQVLTDEAVDPAQARSLRQGSERELRPLEVPPPAVPIDLRRRGHAYVAGQFGYTLAYDFKDVTGTGALAGTSLNNLNLQNSFVYGAKVGYFFSDRLNWLGVEVEAFNTNPHIKQQSLGAIPGTTQTGTTLLVTTVAFNLIARGQFACRLTENDPYAAPVNRYGLNRPTRFCPLQPYVGVGIGAFFAWADRGSESLAAPGLNALAGVRYFVTRNTALFGEYKYNRAAFSFDNVQGGNAGIDGIYSASHFIAGVSFHFW